MNKELKIWTMFRKTYAKSQRIAEEDLRKYGTTPSQFSILWNLSVEEATPMSELSRQSSCVNSNITSIISRMEEKGLVKRVQDKKDRRVVRVELTEEGKELYRKTVPEHKKFLTKLMECYTDQEIETFNSLLNKLYEHVG